MAALPPPTPAAAKAPLWQRVARHVLGGMALSSGVGLFIGLLFRDGFWHNMLISLCIGACIQGLIEAGRYGISAWMLGRGHRSAQLEDHWPGWWIMGPYVLVAALLGYWLGMNLGALLLGRTVPVEFQGGARALVVVLFITVGVSVAATYHFFMHSRVASAQAHAEAARRLAIDHQLRLLQSQLEPHMLFNTLANLRVLVTLDPPRAQAMLDHLIRYLRATLGASHATLHPLAQEFALLDDYLALMALRMGPRLQVSLQLPESLRQQPVPPLLLQPLVENSIRHGLEPQVAGGRIEVQASVVDGRLRLAVRDTGAGLAAAPGPAGDGEAGSHYGTRHVADRLRTLYGDQARFTLAPAADAEGGTLAEVLLPLQSPAEAGAAGAPAPALAARPAAAGARPGAA